ncbi:class I SAM-dependent methyltransferase [Candidatus Saccharibacteria bacterium]|nr:class I SAM-dependent methyltransferase [Candidatus Saccharibacteria bacterium]
MNTILDNNQKTLMTYTRESVKSYVKNNKNRLPQEVEWVKRSFMNLPKNAKMFEIGSGDGCFAKMINSLGYNIQVSDAPDAFIEHLSDIGLDPIKFNWMTDEFPKTYDYILAHAVLVHFSHDEVKLLLKKTFDALRGGGRFVFSVKKGEGEGWVDNYLGVERYFSYWSADDIEQATREAGFSEVELDYIEGNHGNNFFMVIAKKTEGAI